MATNPFVTKAPYLPTKEDIELASQSVTQLVSHAKNGVLKLRIMDDGADDLTLVLPRAAVDLIIQVLTGLSKGKAVTVILYNAELTTQQAADILHCSRDFIVGLCDSGQLPYRKLGTHRKIRFEDLMEYERVNNADRMEALDKLAALHQEIGGYDKP